MPDKNGATIGYSDGVVEDHILDLLRCAESLDSNTDIAVAHYNEWPIQYHLTSTRANAIRHLDFDSLDVLELGAGLGAVSRYLAEHARHVSVVEGSPRRFRALQERLRDLDNWDGAVTNFQNFTTDKKYDVVCFCGVLEYAGRYIESPEPFKWALTHGKSFLKPDGVMLVLIENKNGFKYFAGAAEDHYCKPFVGLCGYPLRNDVKTFSRKEMLTLFSDCGFHNVDVHHLWPDYKLAQAVILDALVDEKPELCASIAASYALRDYSGNGHELFPQNLALASMADSGILGEFSNSYLFLASNRNSETKQKLLSKIESRNARAFLYTKMRKHNVATVFTERAEGLVVEKSFMTTAPRSLENSNEKVFIDNYRTTPYYEGKTYLFVLTNQLYYGDREAFFRTLDRFFDLAFEKYSSDDPSSLRGEAFDAVVQNAIFSDHDDPVFFDIEYRLEKDIKKSMYILRNCICIGRCFNFDPQKNRLSVEGLYNRYCEKYNLQKQFRQEKEKEGEFQRLITHSVKRRKKYKIFCSIFLRTISKMLPVRAWRKAVRSMYE